MGTRGVYATLLLLGVLIYYSTGVETNSNKKPAISWVRPGILTHQSLHSVLVSMEERLRSLENMKYTTNRLDLYLERFTRQLDSLDVRTRTVQIKLEQLETVAQNIVSHELKNDLSTVHLQRKFETNQDRLIHKIGLTENRLDSSITKLQGTVDLGFEKIERKQNDIETRLNNVGNQLDEISQRLIKLEDNANTTTNAIHLSKISDLEDSGNSQMNRITDMLKGIEQHVNKSIQLSEQNDSPNKNPREDDRLKDIIQTELHSEANKIGNKINNMYNDIWGKTVHIEHLLKDVASLTNQSRGKDIESCPSNAEDISCTETIQSVTEDMLGTLGSFLREKLDIMDTNVEGVYAAHKMLLGTYNKMREDGNKFETRLTFVLGKILDTIENRTKNMGEMQMRTIEALKSHNSQVVRTVAYNTNSIKKLAEDSGVEHKNMDNSLNQLLNIMSMDKNESQEYEDNINDHINKRRRNDDKKIKPDNITGVRSNNETQPSRSLDAPVNRTMNPNERNVDKEKESYNGNKPLVIIPDDNMPDFEDNNEKVNSPSHLEDENDKAVTRLLMLYLKTLRGHLTKDKFLYEANPNQPYSSVQEMVKKLKELHFPSDFLKELEEWDSETNDKEVIEDMTEGKELTDNQSEDYDLDKDYLDYPVKDSDILSNNE